MRVRLRPRFVVAAVLAIAAPAFAGEKDFIIYTPGMNGTKDTARPFIGQFTKYIETKRGWPANSSNGDYLEDAGEAMKGLEGKPGFGLIPASMYLTLACGKSAPEPIAAVDGIAGMSNAVRFHIVVKKGTAKTLDDLKGKKLISNHLQDHKYVSRVLLGGKVDIDTFFVVKETKSPVKPFSTLISGEQDAALISDEQLKNAPAELVLNTVFSSDPIAPFPLVAFPDQVKPAEREAVKKTLVAMCTDPAGKQVCESLQITRFAPLDAGAYKAAVQRYCK
jgi:hypothetical protein